LVKPNDSTIDIGSNIGLYTKVLSDLVGSEGRVYSIEPIPATFEILCSNIHNLNLNNVVPINCAFSDKDKEITMEVPHYAFGGENYYQAHIVKNTSGNTKLRRVNIPSKTLDSKFRDISNLISFIKCDVEGHELECLHGAKDILKHSQAAWLIEITGNPDDLQSAANQVFDVMSQNGYASWWFDSTVLRRWSPGENSTNYFFLKKHHIEDLKSKEPNLIV
jgi:FkbM family methyltransferase